jgi:hypothetical protein
MLKLGVVKDPDFGYFYFFILLVIKLIKFILNKCLNLFLIKISLCTAEGGGREAVAIKRKPPSGIKPRLC